LNAFELSLARRYLGATRRGGGLSLITVIAFAGIALSVATLIIVMAVMNGFRDELLGRILGLGGHAVLRTEAQVPDWQPLAQRLRAIEGVERVSPLIDGQALATHQGRSAGVLVRAMPADDIAAVLAPYTRLSSQTQTRLEAGEAVLPGNSLARRLGLFPGGPLTLLSPEGPATPFGVAPRRKTYPVAGTFESGMFEYDDNFIFMPLEEAQAFFSMGEKIDGLEIRVTKPDRIEAWVSDIREAASGQGYLATWKDINSSYFNALATERQVMRLILLLIVAVTTLNIITGLIMLVKDKREDIAILRTMGATRASIMRVFLAAGVFIGGAGTLVGLGLGWAFTANIGAIHDALSAMAGRELFDPEVYFLTEIPARIDPTEVAGVVAFAFIMSAVVTLYPARKAATLDPVEALRYG
jgi:lipoprotein-releasing system permease protein